MTRPCPRAPRCCPPSRSRRDRGAEAGASSREGRRSGFVTVAVAGLMAVLLSRRAALVAALGAVGGRPAPGRGAADLAALAGAAHALEGTACAVAGRVARAQSARAARSCRAGRDVTVRGGGAGRPGWAPPRAARRPVLSARDSRERARAVDLPGPKDISGHTRTSAGVVAGP